VQLLSQKESCLMVGDLGFLMDGPSSNSTSYCFFEQHISYL